MISSLLSVLAIALSYQAIPPGFQITGQLSQEDGLGFVYWSISNTSGGPAELAEFQARYYCNDGSTDEKSHFVRASFGPGQSRTISPVIACAQNGGVSAFELVGETGQTRALPITTSLICGYGTQQTHHNLEILQMESRDDRALIEFKVDGRTVVVARSERLSILPLEELLCDGARRPEPTSFERVLQFVRDIMVEYSEQGAPSNGFGPRNGRG